MKEPTQREMKIIENIVYMVRVAESLTIIGYVRKTMNENAERSLKKLWEYSLHDEDRYQRNLGMIYKKVGRRLNWEAGFNGLPFFKIQSNVL